MSSQGFLLATDLDGTFAGGTSADMLALQQQLADHEVMLVYSTGRSVDSARELVKRSMLPEPAVLIADVGTSVLRGTGPEHIERIEQEIAARWPGTARVRDCLSALPGLELQDVGAPRRVSYWIADNRSRRLGGERRDDFDARLPTDPSLSEAAQRLALSVAGRARAALHAVDVDVLVSGNVYLDVLPRGVNKGTTLLRVLDLLHVPVADCIVAGDSFNDLALFEIGARGIVVGNCEPALRAAVLDRAHVYCARAEGAAGILEGLRHFDVLTAAVQAERGRAHAE